MGFSIFIKQLLIYGILTVNRVPDKIPESMPNNETSNPDTLKMLHYISALPASPVQPYANGLWPDSACYTIQICTMDYPTEDPILNRNNKIRIVRMGELYRYFFSYFPDLQSARKELVLVHKFFPNAFIREYRQEKPGLAIDIQINFTE